MRNQDMQNYFININYISQCWVCFDFHTQSGQCADNGPDKPKKCGFLF